MHVMQDALANERLVSIPAGAVSLGAVVTQPATARGIVVLATGAHDAPKQGARTRFLADGIRRAGFATITATLLTDAERRHDHTGALRFNLPLLEERLLAVIRWALEESGIVPARVGACVTGTVAAAAMRVAAHHPDLLRALACCAGRLAMAHDTMREVHTPTLLVVGGEDDLLVEDNGTALAWLAGVRHLEVLPGVSRTFEAPGELERVAQLAGAWFVRHLL